YGKLRYFVFFFSSRRRHTRLQGDWSSDVCSSDLLRSAAIVDSGPGSTLEALRKQLQARGLSVSDLDALLLTHIHLDHAGASGAQIGRASCRERVEIAVAAGSLEKKK